MISREDVDKLANLARLELDDKQKESLVKDLDNILGYFEQLKEADVSEVEVEEHLPTNVMRADVEAHEAEQFSKTLIEAAPKHNGDYVRVKKIL